MGQGERAPNRVIQLLLKRTAFWLLSALTIPAICQNSSSNCSSCAEWNRPQPPFRIFGNTYYVGTRGLSSVLITSEAGHVLIDGDLPESVGQIVEHIRALGFRIGDVKIIVNSHVHFDHAGGIAELQRLSGARVIASEWSAGVLKHGGVAKDDPQYGTIAGIAPVKNVRMLRDAERFVLGKAAITAHLTPGHTPGGTSWTWKSCEEAVCHDMVYADSVTPVSARGFRFSSSHDYPNGPADFDKSFSFLESARCDILITPHPEVSRLFDRLAERERGKSEAMVDPDACKLLAQQGREGLKRRLMEEGQVRPDTR